MAVQVEDVNIHVGFSPTWKGFSYYCPHCKTVLGVQVNPLTIQTDIQSHVDSQLRAIRNEIVNRIENLNRAVQELQRG